MSIRILLGAAAMLLVCPAVWSADIPYARALYNQKQYEQAASLFEAALDEHPLEAQDMAILGMCYVHTGDYARAEAVLERAMKQDPFDVTVHTAFGNLWFQQQDFERAYRFFRRAYSLDGTSIQAAEGMVASLTNRGVLLYRDGAVEDARAAFLEALEVDPQASQVLRNLGVLELHEGNAEKAEEMLGKAHALAPEDPGVLRLLIAAREELDDSDGLLWAYKRLALLQPFDGEAHAALGLLLQEIGRRDEAEQAFRRAEELGTEEPYPYYHLARSAAGEGRRQDAIYLATQAIGKAIHQTGAIQLQAAQRVQEAEGQLKGEDIAELKQLSEAIAAPQTVLEGSLALLRELHGDDRLFEEDLRKLCSWYSSSVDLKAALGELLQEQKRWDDARRLWTAVLEGHPTNVKAQIGLALSHEAAGDLEAAGLFYLRALELDTENPVIYESLERTYRVMGRETDLLQLYRDRTYRDRRNPVLFRRLSALERKLGLERDSETHLQRAQQIEGERSSSP